MTLNEYQKEALVTALYSGDSFLDLCHWVLGTNGEAGELADKLKKVIRDQDGKMTDENVDAFMKEAGDVLWYVAVLADQLGYSLDDVAKANITKLRSRQKRSKLGGSGDDR